ncbi:MAG: hypothetical protein C5B46_02475 [Proteobacteria bacterium]|nr:MAG: hypothetical protein C5B46_02475 [Pseudomonadota bacterium]
MAVPVTLGGFVWGVIVFTIFMAVIGAIWASIYNRFAQQTAQAPIWRDEMKRTFVVAAVLLAIGLLAAACKPKTDGTGKPAGEVVKSTKVENLTATLLTSSGQMKQGDQEFTLAFNDATGKSVDVGAVSLNFHMPAMGSMAAMDDAATFTMTDIPGVYRGKVNIGMAGEWQAQLAYEGPAGKGKTTFSVTAR